ncbi:snare protein syntaxin 18/UFE1 [Pisolithus orientalis]|uniref:snare protein syntaxin 18/UFE1 n=1 Tax=Pisolithus orientalis TaxID=936130 RepID=UPI0022255ECE|nr:snare protein syntaxin 18/UFE1 [Pisolithus orientalis]KAI6035283.1 snare protein syntaxin 18/UFE1 [Pisolithus orientalis]
MGYTDRTEDFRGALALQRSLTPSKRRKVSTEDTKSVFGAEYLREAYTILNHINTLARMLALIRKPYLSVDSHSSPLGWRGPRNLNLDDLDGTWSEIRYLTNEERDQIDLQARVIFSRCADRIKAMEALEKRRAELTAREINPITRFLPAKFRHDDSTIASEYTAAHHSSITWYLNRRLTEASQTQKSMQEERVKRQLERSRTLGSSAAREAMTIGTKVSLPEKRETSSDRWLEGASSALVSGIVATIGVAQKILTLLRSAQDTLESVQQAEARLMDISNLQMELVAHLTRQTELTDQLYEDAMAITSTVEKGNSQLREARRRAKDSRIFILVFLVGASLSLLFLHFY